MNVPTRMSVVCACTFNAGNGPSLDPRTLSSIPESINLSGGGGQELKRNVYTFVRHIYSRKEGPTAPMLQAYPTSRPIPQPSKPSSRLSPSPPALAITLSFFLSISHSSPSTTTAPLSLAILISPNPSSCLNTKPFSFAKCNSAMKQ